MFGLWESSSNAILDLDGKVAVVTGGKLVFQASVSTYGYGW